MKFLSGLLTRKPAPEKPALTADEVWALRRKSRAERRREERTSQAAARAGSARVCWRCGFGALKGIKGSNLVLMKDNAGTTVWGHGSPLVCAGSVRAVTSQAREEVGEAFSDFRRVLWLRAAGYVRLYWSQFTQGFIRFLKDEGAQNETGGGTRASRQNTRGNV